jgi:hypothetical protein
MMDTQPKIIPSELRKTLLPGIKLQGLKIASFSCKKKIGTCKL